MTKILIVEDESSFSEAISFLLGKEGYESAVAENGRIALDLFKSNDFDLVLLDLMIPEVSGIDVCRTIRTTSAVPIIMLTAKDSEVDKVVGLELGADDYVTKPYSSRELVARIKAVLRRGVPDDGASASNSGIHSVAGIRMDIERHQVTVNGNLIPLPLKEFELLEFLLRNEGRVLTRGQLIDRVWGGDYYGDTKTLDVHIKRLRSKIEVDPANPVLIQTIRGLGYKFEAQTQYMAEKNTRTFTSRDSARCIIVPSDLDNKYSRGVLGLITASMVVENIPHAIRKILK